jgi:hypothetical protein
MATKTSVQLMSPAIYYCRSWFRAKKKPTELWSGEKAEAAYRQRARASLLYRYRRQDHGVGFLDERLRESLTYAFKEVDVGKLFLAMAVHREFEGQTDKVASGVTYTFDQSGAV